MAQQALGTVMAAVMHIIGNPALGIMVRHRVADLVGEASLPADEIAARTGLHPLALTRTLRFLAGLGIFWEVEPGRFMNTPASNLLRDRPGGLRNYVFTLTSEAHIGAFANLAHGIRSGESPFAQVNRATYWEYLNARPEENRAFDAMFAELRGGEHEAIANAFDWSNVGTVVDVGGGSGSLLATILEKEPHLGGVLLDQPEVLLSAESHLQNRGVRARCKLVGGSFFAPIEVSGDVWVLSQILHDWSDTECLPILANCRSAMRPKDELVVAEMLTIPGQADPVISGVDMVMMTLFGNARQRTEAEYRELFAASGFRFGRVIPTNSAFSLIQAQPA